ncbi:hypothetical protein PG989_003617 [Apiospora arundinis]
MCFASNPTLPFIPPRKHFVIRIVPQHRRIMTDEESIKVRADRLLADVPLIDGHNDFPYMIRGWFQNQVGGADFNIDTMPIGQTDLQRLRRGKLGGQFWSAFVPCSTDTLAPLRDTLQQIDLLHLMFGKWPHVFGFVDKAADILPTFKSGRLVSMIGIEGLHSTAESYSALRMFHRLGVRYATLCHNKGNSYCDSATSDSNHDGLSTEGVKVVREMNRIGMIVDLSHTSNKAQIDVLRVSKAPVMFSHSSCYSLCPSPRNVTDEVLSLLKANNGLIMICFLPNLLVCCDHSSVEKAETPAVVATVSSVVDHIIHVGTTIGYEHVGIGSDFDGMLKGPEGLDDVSSYPSIVTELLSRGVSEEDVKLVMGLNVIRLLEEVELASQRAQADESWEVPCDEIPPPWTTEQRALLVATGEGRSKSGKSEGK